MRKRLGDVGGNEEILGNIQEDVVIALFEHAELADGGGQVLGHSPHLVFHQAGDEEVDPHTLCCLVHENLDEEPGNAGSQVAALPVDASLETAQLQNRNETKMTL